MVLEFGIGACGVLFGMKPVDVIKVLGMPDKIDVCDDDDIYAQTYIYNKDMLMVWFEREKDLRVTLIQCFSPEMTVFGRKVFLREKQDVLKLMTSHGCTSFDETDAVTEETVFFDDVAAWFNFEFNKLTYIELGVFFSENGSEELWSFDGDPTFL